MIPSQKDNVCFDFIFRSVHRRCSVRKGVPVPATLLKVEAQVFSCEFCEIFKNNFFTEHLQTAASMMPQIMCNAQINNKKIPNNRNVNKVKYNLCCFIFCKNYWQIPSLTLPQIPAFIDNKNLKTSDCSSRYSYWETWTLQGQEFKEYWFKKCSWKQQKNSKNFLKNTWDRFL